MEQKRLHIFLEHTIPPLIVFVILGALIVHQYMVIEELGGKITLLTEQQAKTTAILDHSVNDVKEQVLELNQATNGIKTSLSQAEQNLHQVANKVGGVESQVGTISNTVGTLEKLAKVDAQILKKYSKVYFLNENYTPEHVTDIDPKYLYSSKQQEQFLTEAYAHLTALIDQAHEEGVTVYVKSGYRSFGVQKNLKSQYAIVYGAGTANTFSADQGYSEHQLGTTVDFITTGLGGSLSGFDKTQAFSWLTEHAHEYGFVLSYPKGNRYYIYEPWHWRYVGVSLATYLHVRGKHFYDLDQREIDTYLPHIFE